MDLFEQRAISFVARCIAAAQLLSKSAGSSEGLWDKFPNAVNAVQTFRGKDTSGEDHAYHKYSSNFLKGNKPAGPKGDSNHYKYLNALANSHSFQPPTESNQSSLVERRLYYPKARLTDERYKSATPFSAADAAEIMRLYPGVAIGYGDDYAFGNNSSFNAKKHTRIPRTLDQAYAPEGGRPKGGLTLPPIGSPLRRVALHEAGSHAANPYIAEVFRNGAAMSPEARARYLWEAEYLADATESAGLPASSMAQEQTNRWGPQYDGTPDDFRKARDWNWRATGLVPDDGGRLAGGAKQYFDYYYDHPEDIPNVIDARVRRAQAKSPIPRRNLAKAIRSEGFDKDIQTPEFRKFLSYLER